MFPPVFETLTADSYTLALVGSAIYRHDDAPNDRVPPYLAWSASIAPENTLSETPGIDRVTVLVNCYSDDDGELLAIATAVRDAIEPFAHLVSMPIDNRDRPDTKLYRMALQFDWFVHRQEAAAPAPAPAAAPYVAPGYVDEGYAV